jgi:hypothetical protein
LTCDFWAEFEEKKCKNKKQQQIPRSTSLWAELFGDESKKGDLEAVENWERFFVGVNRGAMHGKWEQMVVI